MCNVAKEKATKPEKIQASESFRATIRIEMNFSFLQDP